MAGRPIAPQEIIKKYLEHVPRDIRVEGVFLFGSHARGMAKEDSDIDFIVISPDFGRMDFMKRMELLSHVQGADSITRSVPMDIIGYTPKEFKDIDKESIVIRNAKKEGRMLHL